MNSRLESKSAQTRKRIENHTFEDEAGDEYDASKFGGHREYMRRKRIKLQNLDSEIRAKSDNPPIFKGIVVYVNGYTQPSLNDLHTMIVAHGGGFAQYLDGKTFVTHIVASSLTPKKVVEFKRYRIVKPSWIVDSIAAAKCLPWDKYRVVDEGVGQKVLAFNNGQIASQVNRPARGYKDQSDNSWYNTQLKGFQVDGLVSSPKPSFLRGLPASSKPPTLTPEYDDIHDSDFEALEDDDDTAMDIQEPPMEPHEPIDDIPQTPPHTSPAEETVVEPDSVPPHSTSPYGQEASDPRSAKESHTSGKTTPQKVTEMTAEEHNAMLLADPRLRKSTVVNPEFLQQYYRESRLHHLSTWKADLKSQLQALTAEKSASQKARQKRPTGYRRYIMHVDFDSFFAAVSLKKYPQYKDKPCVVAHGSGSGGGNGSEIASCNYPARDFGVKNGMWMKRAQELCPDLKVLPYDFPAYEESSRQFYAAILETGGVVQSVSVDEALIDISAQCIAVGGTDGVQRYEGSNYREQSEADRIGRDLRNEVLKRTGCNVSVGIGANILLAKIALRKAKPAGQFQLKPEDVLDFIGTLEVQSLPGVAYSIGGKLEEIGVKYVKDIRELSKEKLVNTLGPKTGEKIWEYSRGIDKAEVGDQVVRKSVSADVNWGVRFENQEQVDEFMTSLCGELQKRLIKENVKGKQLTVKVMRRSPDAPLDPPKHLGHGKCDTYNKSIQLGVATNDNTLMTKEVLVVMRSFGFSPGELRGIGIQMTKLEPLKAGTDGRADSSQPRLQFKPAQIIAQNTRPKLLAETEAAEDPITDDIKTPKKNRVRDIGDSSYLDSILNNPSPSKRPLNLLGTQFALPTQVDPKVLAELPEEIRARLIKQSRPAQVSENANGRKSPTPAVKKTSRAASAAIRLPNQSQLDPEILNSLPEDVRRDVMAMYQTNTTSPRKGQDQTILPQSPRKNRIIPPVKKLGGRKPRGGGLFARARPSNGMSTLTQANFVARETDAEDTPAEEEGEIDEEFLAALPPEIRKEVLDERRSAQLRRSGGLEASRRPGGKRQDLPANTIEKFFHLPPRPEKPSFTSNKLTELPELRKAVREWVKEFWDEAPYAEDTGALVKYLEAVVKQERDVDKAVKIAKWLGLVVEQEVLGKDGVAEDVQEGWGKAWEEVKRGVQGAVLARGLPGVEFD
ncbi:DNA repair protein [Aureobasidium pullulans EXF-150]|uniref:DNA repair protein REV1 n=1 Tax=Aureobasidium pullulans EXF-150 TaxID=1043002 RepID=A0A074Y4R0_AURPU|nr:DNA repair protein [Aureobasidium pullulans EXF-150]KEQ81906.1 DNA repair protein [Aureobasidium pullulans EXF-150]